MGFEACRVQAIQALGKVGMVEMDAQAQRGQGEPQRGGLEGRLMEVLCPFQLLYSDGVEKLAAESGRG
jgi:hypothetical protein